MEGTSAGLCSTSSRKGRPASKLEQVSQDLIQLSFEKSPQMVILQPLCRLHFLLLPLPPPGGSSEQHPFPERMYIPGNPQFSFHRRKELAKGLEDSPVEQATPCSQAPDGCWDADTARAGTPAAPALVHHVCFGISVLARPNLEPTSAVPALAGHLPLQDLSLFSSFAFCREALTQPMASIHPGFRLTPVCLNCHQLPFQSLASINGARSSWLLC